MLAEIYSIYSIGNVLCLSSIVFLIIGLLCYSKGVIVGSSTNFIFFVICLIGFADPGETGEGLTSNNSYDFYISNDSQSKFIKKYSTEIILAHSEEEGSIFYFYGKNPYVLGPEEVNSIMYKNKCSMNDIKVKDLYNYNRVYYGKAARWEMGDGGLPQWLWSPSSSIWIFGILSLPSMFVGGIISFLIRK